MEQFGLMSQLIIAAEECSELTKAIMKLFRSADVNETVYRDSSPESISRREDVLEELADVSLCVEQLVKIFGEERFNEHREAKINRLRKRIDQYKAEGRTWQ